MKCVRKIAPSPSAFGLPAGRMVTHPEGSLSSWTCISYRHVTNAWLWMRQLAWPEAQLWWWRERRVSASCPRLASWWCSGDGAEGPLRMWVPRGGRLQVMKCGPGAY